MLKTPFLVRVLFFWGEHEAEQRYNLKLIRTTFLSTRRSWKLNSMILLAAGLLVASKVDLTVAQIATNHYAWELEVPGEMAVSFRHSPGYPRARPLGSDLLDTTDHGPNSTASLVYPSGSMGFPMWLREQTVLDASQPQVLSASVKGTGNIRATIYELHTSGKYHRKRLGSFGVTIELLVNSIDWQVVSESFSVSDEIKENNEYAIAVWLSGDLKIDWIQLEEGTSPSAYQPNDPIVYGIWTDRPGALFTTPEPVPLKLYVANNSSSRYQASEKIGIHSGLDYSPRGSLTINVDVPAGEQRVYNFSLPSSLGHYQLELAKDNSIKAELAVSIVPPRKDIPTTLSHFGVDMDEFEDPATINQMLQLGTTWQRTFIYHSSAEPQPGQWDWSNLDQYVNFIKDHNMEIMAHLGGHPVWNSRDGSGGHYNYPRSWAPWEEFVSRAVRRYSHQIKDWVVQLEPWAGAMSEQEYYDLMVHTAPIARQAAQEIGAEITVYGPDWIWDEHTEEFVRLGGNELLDGIALLLDGIGPQRSVYQAMRQGMQMLDAPMINTGAGREWADRVSYRSRLRYNNNPVEGVRRGPRFIIAHMTEYIAGGVRYGNYYNNKTRCCWFGLGLESSTGFYNGDGTFKPMAVAQAVMANLMDGSSYVKTLYTGDSSDSYLTMHLFHNLDNSLVLVPWVAIPVDLDMTIQNLPVEAQVISALGETQTTIAAGASSEILVGWTPKFIVLPQADSSAVTAANFATGATHAADRFTIQETVSPAGVNVITTQVFGSSSNPPSEEELIYQRFHQSVPAKINYDWFAPVIRPDPETILLYRFNNDPAFGEAPGIIHDYSGRGHTGSGNPDQSLLEVGLFAASAEFQGQDVSDEIRTPHQADLVGMDELTIEMWLKKTPETSGAGNSLLSKGLFARAADNVQAYSLFLRETSKVIIFIVADVNGNIRRTATQFSSARFIEDGQWHKLTAVYSGKGTPQERRLDVYLDGELVNGTLTLTKTIDGVTVEPDGIPARINPGSTGDLIVSPDNGRTSSHSPGGPVADFGGAMEELVITKRALSHEEVLARTTLDFGQPHYYFVRSIDELNQQVFDSPIKTINPVTSLHLDETTIGFNLFQNYPNPFNPITTIRYQVHTKEHIVLKIYDILGREVAVLVDEQQPPGAYSIEFDADGLASGVYVYRLKAGSFTGAKKLLFLK